MLKPGLSVAVGVMAHNIHHVFQVADRIIVVRRGKIAAEFAVAGTGRSTVGSVIAGADLSRLRRDAKENRTG
jgi:simple sugar transport system ATP-binding protein